MVLQDDDGQIALTHSISAGLDYASVGRNMPGCATLGAPNYTTPPMKKRSPAVKCSSRMEGIIPALESRPTPSPISKNFAPTMSKRPDYFGQF